MSTDFQKPSRTIYSLDRVLPMSLGKVSLGFKAPNGHRRTRVYCTDVLLHRLISRSDIHLQGICRTIPISSLNI